MFYTFSTICNDNAAIDYVTVQDKEIEFPSTLTGHSTVVS